MKNSNKLVIALLGIGALSYFAYTQLSDDDKLAIKEKCRKLFDELVSPLIAIGLGIVDDKEIIE